MPNFSNNKINIQRNETKINPMEQVKKMASFSKSKPCQRSLNENNNGILRRYLPKSIDLSHFNQKFLNQIAFQINSTPRKSLSYKRPIDLIKLF